MKLQYLSEHKSITKSYFIPIAEWNALKSKPREAEREELSDIPEWQKQLLAERIEAYRNGLEEVFDSEEVLQNIEKDLY